MTNRFSLTDAFGPANEHVARINRICKETRARNQEALQESTLSVREALGPISPAPGPRDSGKPHPAPMEAAPHSLTVINGEKQ